MPPGVHYRELRSHEDFRDCVEIQRETWGTDFTEVVPAGCLAVIEKTGGILVGAFLERDTMVGFVFSLAGFRQGEPIQWSHMLAVVEEARGLGIGRTLKLRQREAALERGVDRVLWTFDPLQSRNAHLNLNRLGVHVVEYVPDMYGGETGSPLHGGGATDRFVVEWRLRDDRTRAALDGRLSAGEGAADGAPLLERTDTSYPDAERVRIRIPDAFLKLAKRDPREAGAWRRATRRSFRHYLERGYRVDGFSRRSRDGDGAADCFYVLRAGTGRET